MAARPPNRTRFAVLSLLRLQPMSGYDLKKASEASIGHFWSESFGQIYPVLARLEREKLVRELPRRDPGSRARRVYAITAAGRKTLRAWLEAPTAPRTQRDELMLKLFCGSACPPEIHRGHVADLAARTENQLAEYRATGQTLEERFAGADDLPHWKLTLRAGILSLEARLAWCREAETALAALAGAGRRRPASRKRRPSSRSGVSK